LQDIARQRGDEAVLGALQRPLAAFTVPVVLLIGAGAMDLQIAWKGDIRRQSNGAVDCAWKNIDTQTTNTWSNVAL
jgi:hypothetical protein